MTKPVREKGKGKIYSSIFFLFVTLSVFGMYVRHRIMGFTYQQSDFIEHLIVFSVICVLAVSIYEVQNKYRSRK